MQLHLDDVGPHVGEVASGDGPRPVGRDLDEAQPRERPTRLVAGNGRGNGRGRVLVGPGEVVGEHGLRVFAERRGGGDRDGRAAVAGQLPGQAGREQLAAPDAQRAEPVARGQLRAGGHVGHRVHGRDGDAQLLRGVVDLLLRARLRPGREGVHHLAEARGPDQRVRPRFVLQQVEALNEHEEVGVGHEVEEEDEAIGAGHERGARAALHRALMRPDSGQPGVVAEHGLLVGDLDALAAPRFARVPQPGERGHGGVGARVEGHLMAGQGQRLALGVAAEVVVAACGVLREGAGLPVRARAAASVGRERDDHGAFAGGGEALLEAVGGGPAFGVEDDVGAGGEPFEARIVGREDGVELARRQPGEEGALALHEGELGARGIAVGRLHLDHLRAEVGEQAPAEGVGHARGQFERNHARERRRQGFVGGHQRPILRANRAAARTAHSPSGSVNSTLHSSPVSSYCPVRMLAMG